MEYVQRYCYTSFDQYVSPIYNVFLLIFRKGIIGMYNYVKKKRTISCFYYCYCSLMGICVQSIAPITLGNPLCSVCRPSLCILKLGQVYLYCELPVITLKKSLIFRMLKWPGDTTNTSSSLVGAGRISP